MSVPAIIDPNRAAFNARRDMIVHEDQLINARLTALLLAQSFLATAAAVLLANAHHPGNAPGFYWLTLLISGLSMLLGVLTNYSIAAAQLEQRYLRERTEQYEKVFPFNGPDASEWRRCLQSHTVLTLQAGSAIASWLPKTTTIAWVGFVYYCLYRISGWQAALVTSIVMFVAVSVIFVYVYLRMSPADKATR